MSKVARKKMTCPSPQKKYHLKPTLRGEQVGLWFPPASDEGEMAATNGLLPPLQLRLTNTVIYNSAGLFISSFRHSIFKGVRLYFWNQVLRSCRGMQSFSPWSSTVIKSVHQCNESLQGTGVLIPKYKS